MLPAVCLQTGKGEGRGGGETHNHQRMQAEELLNKSDSTSADNDQAPAILQHQTAPPPLLTQPRRGVLPAALAQLSAA